jgi:hypothetical protein
MPIDGPERDLIVRLRARACEVDTRLVEQELLREAADMIEQMAQRIEVAEGRHSIDHWVLQGREGRDAD